MREVPRFKTPLNVRIFSSQVAAVGVDADGKEYGTLALLNYINAPYRGDDFLLPVHADGNLVVDPEGRTLCICGSEATARYVACAISQMPRVPVAKRDN